MQNYKSPGSDGLTKEFYEIFWNKLKEILVDSLSENPRKSSVRFNVLTTNNQRGLNKNICYYL